MRRRLCCAWPLGNFSLLHSGRYAVGRPRATSPIGRALDVLRTQRVGLPPLYRLPCREQHSAASWFVIGSYVQMLPLKSVMSVPQ